MHLIASVHILQYVYWRRMEQGPEIDGFEGGGARATGTMNNFKRIGHFAARRLHILQYVYRRRRERESGRFPRLTPIQTLLTDSFPGNGNLPRLHARLRALLLLHRRKPSYLHETHDITSRVTVSMLLYQRGAPAQPDSANIYLRGFTT